MVCQKPIVIDPATIVAVGEMKLRRVGRPKKGVTREGGAGKGRTYNLSEQAHDALARAAVAFGVSESALVEAIARSLDAYSQSA